MSLQLSLETNNIYGNDKPDLGRSGLLGGPGETELFADDSIIPRPQNFDNRGKGMSAGFIKIYKDTGLDLLENDPDAFLLLTQIAFRALRKPSKYSKSNLQPNQALIGDYKKIGLTEQRYRDAKERIEQKYKLATFKGTNKGTVATILNTEIYDINSNSGNEQSNEQKELPATTQERTENDPGTTQERLKKNERKKEFKNNNPQPPPSEGAVEIYKFFVESLKKYLPQIPESKHPRPETARNFDSLLKDHTAESLKKLITFAHSGWWARVIHGPKTFRDKFVKLQISMERDETKAPWKKEPEKSSPVTADGPRRVNELVV